MRIVFAALRVVDDARRGTPAEERYEPGRVYDLPEASARRWINRGAARPAPVETRVRPDVVPRHSARPKPRA